MRLKSNSAESCTRARPGPTTEETIDSIWSFSRRSKPAWRSSAVPPIAPVDVARRAVGEQLAGLVDDRDALRLQAVHRRGDQVADRAHLLRLERAAHAQHDRGRRLDLVAREQRALRQHQMHARRLHPVDRLDGARELAFERAQVIDVLDEAGRAERVGLVEDLVADAAALGQAAFGELHAHAGHLVARHQHDGAVVLELVGDGLALEVLHDRGGILGREVGEHRRHLRRRDAQDDEGEDADQGHGDGGHGGKARRAQRPDEFDEPLHRSCPSHSDVARRDARPTRQVLPGSWFPSG